MGRHAEFGEEPEILCVGEYPGVDRTGQSRPQSAAVATGTAEQGSRCPRLSGILAALGRTVGRSLPQWVPAASGCATTTGRAWHLTCILGSGIGIVSWQAQ